MERKAIAHRRTWLTPAKCPDRPAFDEHSVDVYCWRMERLLEAGYTRLVADALAQDTRVDLHGAVDLVRAGCPADAAARILL
jgi:hypothetical protein